MGMADQQLNLIMKMHTQVCFLVQTFTCRKKLQLTMQLFHSACQIFNIGRFLATTEIRSADRYWHVYSPKRDMIYRKCRVYFMILTLLTFLPYIIISTRIIADSYKPAVVSMMWDVSKLFFMIHLFLLCWIDPYILIAVDHVSVSDMVWVSTLRHWSLIVMYLVHFLYDIIQTPSSSNTFNRSAPYLAYGIQLLPLTPVSERRDTDQWLRQLYPSFVESCESSEACVNEGWAVLLYSVLASLGHRDSALTKTLELPRNVFDSAGGSGHSLTNSLWYIASRENPTVPYDLEKPSQSIHSKTVTKTVKATLVDCGCPDTCTAESLDTNADGFTCKERIQWLMLNRGLNELGACKQVAGEYPSTCGSCDPVTCAEKPIESQSVNATSRCQPCKEEMCASELNRCQIDTAPYLCYEGNAKGGCSSVPWPTGEGIICAACCEVFSGC